MKDVISGAVAVATGPGGPKDNPFDILPIFMVQQNGGKWRLIHDARETNRDLPPSSAAYEYVNDISRYPEATVATKLDMMSAYRNVRIAWSDSLRLAFQAAGYTVVYRTLPFGLSWAPARFLDAVRPAILQARAEGHFLVWYMDDVLVLGRDEDHLVAGVRRVVELLRLLRLRIAPDKFFAVAATRLDFLGHVVDLVDGTISPTPSRLEELTSTARSLALSETVPVRSLQRVGGILAFSCHAANTRIPLRALPIAAGSTTARTVDNYSLLRQELTAIACLTPPDLTFHYRDDAARRSGQPIHIVGDPGDHGWAALWVTEDGLAEDPAADAWSEEELETLASSAAREIDTIRRALAAFDVHDAWVVYTSDAQAAVGAVRNRARSAGTAKAVLQLVTECRARRVSLDVRWTVRSEGWLPLADALGRPDADGDDQPTRPRLASAEWAIDPTAFHSICNALGVSPTIDLFASPTLHQLPRFASRSPFADGSVGDGLLLPLADELPYVFAPWSVMSRAVRRLAARDGPKQAILLARVHEDCRGFQSLAAAEAARDVHVTAAVDVHYTCLQSALGVPATKELWPLKALLVERRAGPTKGQPLWWTRERLVGIHPNPGPGTTPPAGGGDGDAETLPEAWKAAAQERVTRAAPTDPTVAAAVQALLRGGDALAEVTAAVGTAVPRHLLQLLAALHAAFIPAATAAGHTRHSRAFGEWITRQPGVAPTAPWTDDVACTYLAAWADGRANQGIAASSIRTEVFSVRAVLRLWGAPIRDERRVLSSALFRLGCLRRDTKSAKRPFTFVHLQRIEAHLRKSGAIADIRELMLLTGTVLAFALVQRGETIRSLLPRHVSVGPDGAIRMDFDGTRKNDPAFKAAAPQGLSTGRACELAARLLAMWISVLPEGWDGPLFPRLTRARMAARDVVCNHRGYQWSRDQTTRDVWNNAIKRWCDATGITEHLTFHCLRVGGALDVYRATGGDTRLLQAIGGWASQAFRLYIAVSVEEAIMRAPAPDVAPAAGETHRRQPPTTSARRLAVVDDDDDDDDAPPAAAPPPAAAAAGVATTSAARPLTGVCALCASDLGPTTSAALCGNTACHLMCCRSCHPQHDFRFTWKCPVHADL